MTISLPNWEVPERSVRDLADPQPGSFVDRRCHRAQRRAAPHLFRTGQVPPLRGTSVQPDERSLLLYTRGSIPFFRTYPGMYVPQPLLIRPATDGTDLRSAAIDVLAMSKMNWNNAQLDEPGRGNS
jgi:hypothetical protein